MNLKIMGAKMKILYVTTKAGTMSFFVETIKSLINDGNEVEIACNCENSRINPKYKRLGIKIHDLSCTRTPLSKSTIKTIRELSSILSEYSFDIVHCHTPVASICARLACWKYRKKGLKVIYTAHGFHFFK